MKKRKLTKIIIISLIIIAVIAGGLITFKTLLSKKSNDNTFYKVNEEVYENVIEISGTIAAAQEQTLKALSAGTVQAVYVKAGDKVKKGDIIMQLDDTSEQYNLAKHDYDMATKRVSGSTRELNLMETQRLSLLQKISDRQVVATFDGVIAKLDVAVGDYLEAKDDVGTLVNTDYLTAEVEIPETDVQKLVVGQKVNFTFSALNGETVEGYVVGWPAIGEVTSRGATIVKAKVRIDNFPDTILPNFSFTGKIELSPTQTYLVVSRYAIGYENKEPYVVLLKNGEKRSVTIERYGKDNVKILSGVEAGELLQQVTAPKTSGSKAGQGGPGGAGGQTPPSGMGGGMGGFSGGPGGPPGM